MTASKSILILGASYGSLLGIRLLMAGHDVTLVCLPGEAARLNAEGLAVRLPVRGRDEKVALVSRDTPGTLSAVAPDAMDPSGFDLAVLAMQEPQYRAPALRALLGRIDAAAVPMLSIMNMPPLAYLARLPGLSVAGLAHCSADAGVWEGLTPGRITLASPDPQAFRPDPADPTRLEVSLPSNFKVAPFEDPAHTALLTQLSADIEAARVTVDGTPMAVPVKLKVHDSLFVPLAKWAMLIAGNYRCIGADGMRPIREAVHSDPQAAREVYDWVCNLCTRLGAAEDDLVAFEKYAAAAQGLAKPSSVARALAAGATEIERVDALVATVAAGLGLANPELDAVVGRVDAWLAHNRAAAA